jgi:phosphatidylserine synthase
MHSKIILQLLKKHALQKRNKCMCIKLARWNVKEMRMKEEKKVCCIFYFFLTITFIIVITFISLLFLLLSLDNLWRQLTTAIVVFSSCDAVSHLRIKNNAFFCTLRLSLHTILLTLRIIFQHLRHKEVL